MSRLLNKKSIIVIGVAFLLAVRRRICVLDAVRYR